MDEDLERLEYRKLGSQEQEEWHVLRIAAAFRRGDRELAFARAIEARSALPDSAGVAFALGQEYENRGDTARMLECFALAVFPKVSGHHVLAVARYAYLWDVPEAGLRSIGPLLNTYFKLRIADDTFLHIRGLPFISRAIGTALCLYWLGNQVTEGEALLAQVRAKTVEWNAEAYCELARRCFHRDAEGVSAMLRLKRAAGREQSMLHGLWGMRVAAWEARCAAGLREADAILDRVRLTDQDFPWLDDMRLCCRAESRHRFGEAPESAAIAGFMTRQPLLFEPDLCLDFGLLPYQETLKQLYRAARRIA